MTGTEAFPYDFELMCELSARPPHAIPHQEIIDELEREIDSARCAVSARATKQVGIVQRAGPPWSASTCGSTCSARCSTTA